MESKSYFSTVVDSDTNTTFAVLVLSDGVVTAHGSMKQGKDWADWVNSGYKSLHQLSSSLDPSLKMGEFVPLTEENVRSDYSSFGPTTAKELISLIDTKSNAETRIETKSDPNAELSTKSSEAADEHPSDRSVEDEPESEPIRSWMISDVSISMFDVQMKRDAVDFKARQFVRNNKFASFVLSVKGSKASVVSGNWTVRPHASRDLSQVLEGFDRKIKTNAFAFLDRNGYFEKMVPIGFAGLPPAHIARDADKDFRVWEGYSWINRGQGILDPTPDGAMGSAARGMRSFGGRLANIFDQPNRVRRMTRRDRENSRRNDATAAINDLNQLVPKPSSERCGNNRLKNRLLNLAEEVSEFVDGEITATPRTRREIRRFDESSARIQNAGEYVDYDAMDEPSAGMRQIRGDSPETPPAVSAAEERLTKPDKEILPGETETVARSERGDSPRGDGNGMLGRLSSRISRITRRINSSDKNVVPESETEEIDPPNNPIPTPSVISDDPWVMDDATRAELASLVRSVTPIGTYATFSSRFGEDEIDWHDLSPAEQSSVSKEIAFRRDELINIVQELLTPILPGDKDYRVDGVVTPDSVRQAIKDNHVSLHPGGGNLYADVASLLAIDDFLGAKPYEVDRQSSAWRSIDNRNRSVISKRADIQSREIRDQMSRRARGTLGERTVISQAETVASPNEPRTLTLSKLQPRRLVFTPEKPSGLRLMSEYQQPEQDAILASAAEMRKSISDFLRANLGISQTAELTEDVLADWMSRSSPENAARIQKYAHNLIVLDDFLAARAAGLSGDLEWNNLTQPARERILANSNVVKAPQTVKTTKRKPRTPKAPTPVAPSAPQPPTTPTTTDSPAKQNKPQVGIGLSRVGGKLGDLKVPDQDSVSTFDASTQTVTTTAEDGTQETKQLSSFGRPNQYDFSNGVMVNGVAYVMETNLGLYRDPISGEYLTDYSKVPISIDTQITPAAALEPVQTSKKTGSIVSYPSVTPLAKDKNKQYGLTRDQSMSQTEMLSAVFGLDATQAEALVGSRIYFAPGVMPGKSTDSFRQAAMLMLHTASLTSAIPDAEKQDLQLLELVDIPEGADVIETYLNHIGKPDLAVAYVVAGRPSNFLDMGDSSARQGLNIPVSALVPTHLKGAASSSGSNYYSRQAQLVSIFGGDDSSDKNGLVPGMRSDSQPAVRKMVIVWRHPENYPRDRYRYRYGSGNLTHIQSIAQAINKALASDSPQDWYEAFEMVKNAYESAKDARDAALRKWRGAAGEKSRTPRPRREFILSGDLVESLETILADVFGPNMHKVADSVRNKKSQAAKVTNEMGRLRRRAQQTGIRNVAGLEDGMLSPPTAPDGSPLAPREAQQILDMLEAHATQGFLPHVSRTMAPGDPLEISDLSEEAISTLALIGMSVERMIDPETQLPLAEVYPDIRGGVTRKHALHNAIYWAIGAKGRPILVSEDEMALLLGSSAIPDTTTPIEPRDYVPNFYQIRRGISQQKTGKTTHQMAQEFIDGKLFIPLEGGNAGGNGHNFARTGAGMSGYGGNDPHGDIILAAVPKTARLDNRGRMATLQSELHEMFGAFFTSITLFAGIEKTMPIDLDATDDPDWSHDNASNPFYKKDRPNVAHGYFVPHGARTVGAHRGQSSGEALLRKAREMGMSIPRVDTSDLESIRDLAKVIMAVAEEQFKNTFDSEETPIPGDPFYGDQWWRATRAQVFGWMVQLEILKAMEMAKLKSEGKVPWSSEVANYVMAQELISWWNDEIIQAMLFGVDVYSADSSIPLTTNPLVALKGYNIGTHIMVVNRTSLIVLKRPVTESAERDIADAIRNPQIRKPGDPSMVWNPYRGTWVQDPDQGSGE